MSTLWQPGMKAVCIKEDRWKIANGVPYSGRNPVKGEVLEVGRVMACGDETWLQFIEIAIGAGRSPYYASCAFRPVVPRKTSIKIFTDILKEVEAKEPVEGLPW